MRAEAGARPVRQRPAARVKRGRARLVRRVLGTTFWAVAAILLVALVTGLVYAGSESRIAGGVTVAGVDVGGLTAEEAQAVLAERAASAQTVPMRFTALGKSFTLRPGRLDVRADWSTAVADALEEGNGPFPLRGLQRVKLRLFGADVEPRADVYQRGLDYEVNRMASAIDAPAREAAIELRGLRPVVVPGQAGAELDREAAKPVIVAALAGFERDPVALPVDVDRPAVSTRTLAPVVDQVRTVLSGPVRLVYRQVFWTVRPAELASLLDLPHNGTAKLALGGPASARWFDNLARGVRRAPVDADFDVAADGRARVVRARSGRVLDVPATKAALLESASRLNNRTAPLVVSRVAPDFTTREARALRIERSLASYTTLYSGTPDRIQNLKRAVTLLDGARIAPGGTFSFNARVGPRTKERGFRSAPIIVGNEYEEGIGGGVSQVATTVFNAAWEAGLRISARTAHALYIDRYPLGRDATVSYPGIDLAFVNDTRRWVFLKAEYGDTGIVVSLLGAGPERTVTSEAGELTETAPPQVQREPDPTMFVGERVIVEYGEPARAVQVTRTVSENGKVLYDETWSTAYKSTPQVVRVGTKPLPVEPPPPPPLPEERARPKTSPPPPPPEEETTTTTTTAEAP
jgi:vancomycin resistance protein YoaR